MEFKYLIALNLEVASYGMFGANIIEAIFCPNLNQALTYSFANATLTILDLPNVVDLSPLAFNNCKNIKYVKLDLIEKIVYAFDEDIDI